MLRFGDFMGPGADVVPKEPRDPLGETTKPTAKIKFMSL